jgi:putative transposase
MFLFGYFFCIKADTMDWDFYDFDIILLTETDISRKKSMMGSCALPPYDRKKTLARARLVFVPFKIFNGWVVQYLHKGDPGLDPEWTKWLVSWTDEIEDEEIKKQFIQGIKEEVKERYLALGPLADKIEIYRSEIQALADSNGWTLGKTEDWLRRYRGGGLIGLSSRGNPTPHKPRTKRNRKLRSIGGYTPTIAEDNARLQKIFHRHEMLGPLAEKDEVSNAEIIEQAEKVNISPRTMRYLHSDFIDFGFSGLDDLERDDKGKSHSVSERMENIIRYFRLRKRRPSTNWVHKQACIMARYLNEVEPTPRKVREIINEIPNWITTLSDKRWKAFKNNFRLTHTWIFAGDIPEVWQVDTTQIDLLNIDPREDGSRSPSGELKLYLTAVIHYASRACLAYIFTINVPDRITIGTVLYKAAKIYGRPDEIWVDNGSQYIAKYTVQITQDIKTVLHHCHVAEPQEKGVMEAFWSVLNKLLWKDMKGYTGPNVVERDENVKAEHLPSHTIEKFEEFLKTKYHVEPCDATGISPNKYWEDAIIDEIPPDVLSGLLMIREPRIIQKDGIALNTKAYFDVKMDGCVGQNVFIKYPPYDHFPDSIEVFDRDLKWMFTAHRTDSPVGKSLTPLELSLSQRNQRNTEKLFFTEKKDAYLEALDELSEENRLKALEEITKNFDEAKPDKESSIPPKNSKAKIKKNKPTLLELKTQARKKKENENGDG